MFVMKVRILHTLQKLKFNKMKARVGTLVKVKNQNKKHSENESYYSVILKDASGFASLIFTENEIKTAHNRALKNQEDCISRSFASYLLD